MLILSLIKHLDRQAGMLDSLSDWRALKCKGMRKAQWLQVREQFLSNLRSEAYWRGSNLPQRVSSHAVLTDEGSHMFFLAVRTWQKSPERMLLTTGEGRPWRKALLAQQNDRLCCIISTWIRSSVENLCFFLFWWDQVQFEKFLYDRISWPPHTPVASHSGHFLNIINLCPYIYSQ